MQGREPREYRAVETEDRRPQADVLILQDQCVRPDPQAEADKRKHHADGPQKRPEPEELSPVEGDQDRDDDHRGDLQERSHGRKYNEARVRGGNRNACNALIYWLNNNAKDANRGWLLTRTTWCGSTWR